MYQFNMDAKRKRDALLPLCINLVGHKTKWRGHRSQCQSWDSRDGSFVQRHCCSLNQPHHHQRDKRGKQGEVTDTLDCVGFAIMQIVHHGEES